MENKLVLPQRPTGLFVSILGTVVVILAILTLMAGLPPADQIPAFVIGVVVLIAVIVGIGLLAWHLMLRPLPAGVQVVEQPLLTTRARQIIALILTLGPLSIGIAGVWDEIWHSKYGIPFGEDFFWRPHLLLYFGLTTLIFVGGWSWWTMMRKGKGTLQQRFRANPLMGISFLGGLFTIYAVGADPIWHRFYGADIAPWSLPHLLILLLILVMGLLGITYHKSLMPQQEWRLGINFTVRNVLITLVLVGALLDYLLIFTIQWYAANSSAKQLTQIMNYPDWMMAVFIGFLATFFGVLTLHSTRQIGTATLVGALTLLARFLLDNGIGGVRVGTTPLGLILPIMIALDVSYAIALRRTQKPPIFWLTAGIAALTFAVIGLPLTNALFVYPSVTLSNAPMMIIAAFIASAAGAWLGTLLGGINGYGDEATVAAESVMPPSMRLANVLLYVAFAAFLIFFVATATPPV